MTIVLILLVWAVAVALALTLCRAASEGDRIAGVDLDVLRSDLELLTRAALTRADEVPE